MQLEICACVCRVNPPDHINLVSHKEEHCGACEPSFKNSKVCAFFTAAMVFFVYMAVSEYRKKPCIFSTWPFKISKSSLPSASETLVVKRSRSNNRDAWRMHELKRWNHNMAQVSSSAQLRHKHFLHMEILLHSSYLWICKKRKKNHDAAKGFIPIDFLQTYIAFFIFWAPWEINNWT